MKKKDKHVNILICPNMSLEIKIKAKRKKGIKNDDDFKRNLIKKKKLCGEEHVNHVGKTIEPKNTPNDIDTNCCSKNCLGEIKSQNLAKCMTDFYGLQTKNEQDLHLQRLIEIDEVQRRRGRETTVEGCEKTKTFSATYHIIIKGKRFQICKTGFLNVHNCGKKRVERILMLLKEGKSPIDLRGRTLNRGNQIPGEICDKIHEHIESFPVKECHYGEVEKRYLSSDLSIKKMHGLFLEKYPELIGRVKYYFYWDYFRKNFRLTFGRPAVDTCCTCEDLTLKTKNGLLSEDERKNAAAELIQHKFRARKFYNTLKEVTQLSKEKGSKVLGLCFDFMSVLSLPKIPVQEIYYYRQLSVNNFGIYNLRDEKMTCYAYHEGICKKSPDDVTSFLLHYIENFLDHKDVEELHLFCDNCSGQNKNHAFIRFVMALVELKIFKKVIAYFPLRGHSFLPCDRSFGLIKRQLKKIDRIYTVDQYVDEVIAKSCSIRGKFTTMVVNQSVVKNFQDWFPEFYIKKSIAIESRKKNLKKNDVKETFSISSYHYFEVDSEKPGVILARRFIGGDKAWTFRLRKPRTGKLAFPEEEMYSGKIPINEDKMNDLRKVQHYIPEEYKAFWNEIMAYPTVKGKTDD